MTKHKSNHDTRGAGKAPQHGAQQRIGPTRNTRHPRKFKLDKKTAPGAADTDGGKADKVLEGSNSTSNDTTD